MPESKPKGTILLINGLTYSLLDWPLYFVDALVKGGYHVIRHDNRDVGMSDWTQSWTKAKAYSLEDMAADAIAVLDHLNVKKAHILGASMGGMIAQRAAISYSDRVQSLTSIMSTGFTHDPQLVSLPWKFRMDLLRALLHFRPLLAKDSAKIKFQLAVQYILKGKGNYKVDDLGILQKSYYEIERRKGYNPRATDRHAMAIKKSGSRYDELKQLKIPCLVIHGTDDPLIKFEHAKKYAPMIPRVETLFLEGMGHDLPKAYNSKIVKRILAHLESA
jgi:pimeloyl-ACP methyl ester carboxylesterase